VGGFSFLEICVTSAPVDMSIVLVIILVVVVYLDVRVVMLLLLGLVIGTYYGNEIIVQQTPLPPHLRIFTKYVASIP
jgi:hypothetical protein